MSPDQKNRHFPHGLCSYNNDTEILVGAFYNHTFDTGDPTCEIQYVIGT